MGNEQEEGGSSPSSLFGNIFVGRKETWQEIPLAIKEQCQWLEYPPENCDKASLYLFDGEHPDSISFVERSCVPVIVMHGRKSPEIVERFNKAGAFDVLCGRTEVEQIVSMLRMGDRLNGRFNHIIEAVESKQTKTLLHTAQSIGLPHDVDQILVKIVDSIMEVVNAVNVTVVQVDIENEQILDMFTNATWGVGEPPVFTYPELQDGLSGYAIRLKKTIVSSGLKLDEREKVYVQKKRTRTNTGALIVAPLMYDNVVIGTCTAAREYGQPDFTQTEVDTVSTMVQMGAVAIKNAQLSQNVSDALDQTQILLNVAEALISSDNPAALLERVLQEVINGLNGTGGMYIHYDVTGQRIISSQRFIKCGNIVDKQFVSDYDFFMGGLSGYAIQSKEAILSVKQDDERQSEDVHKYRRAENSGCVIVAPIINSGMVLGTISVHRSLGEPSFTERELGILTAVANQIASALIHVRSFEDTKLRVDILAKRLEQRNRDLELRNSELRHANKQLQQVDKLKDKFINEVSHELRRPVTAFRLYLGLLGKRPENIERYLQTLDDETNKFEALIAAILDLARLHIVDTEVQVESVDFAHLIWRQVSLYRPKIEASGVLFDDHSAPLLLIEGLPHLLDKMLEHLLKNALHYTDNGCVVVSSGNEGEVVWFQIEDSGIGIPEGEIPLLHHRFYRGKQVEQERPGIGLGLSFVDEIIKLHKGTLNITSKLGEGSTFRVTLPKQL